MKFLSEELERRYRDDVMAFGQAFARSELRDGEQVVVEVLDQDKIIIEVLDDRAKKAPE